MFFILPKVSVVTVTAIFRPIFNDLAEVFVMY